MLGTFDQAPNPIYQLPTLTRQQQSIGNSPNIPSSMIEEIQFMTIQLNGDFPASAPNQTTTHYREYASGLLRRDSVVQRNFIRLFRYDYERY